MASTGCCRFEFPNEEGSKDSNNDDDDKNEAGDVNNMSLNYSNLSLTVTSCRMS